MVGALRSARFAVLEYLGWRLFMANWEDTHALMALIRKWVHTADRKLSSTPPKTDLDTEVTYWWVKDPGVQAYRPASEYLGSAVYTVEGESRSE